MTFERNMLIIVVYDVFQVARHPDAVTVVTGIVGCAGLKVRLRFSLSESFQNCCDTPAKISLRSQSKYEEEH